MAPPDERGLDVHEPEPERVADGEAQATRLRHGKEERIVDRHEAPGHGRDQVHAEEELPQVEVRGRVLGHQLHDHQPRLGPHRVPVVVDPVARVAVHRPIDLVHDVERGARAMTPALGVIEDRVPVRGRAREEARARCPDALVDRRKELARLAAIHEANLAARRVRQAEGGAGALDLDAGRQRGEAVAEALIDAPLRRPERRQRLAALVNVVELAPHHLAQDPAPSMRRLHAHGADPGRRQLPARNGQVKGDDGGIADHPIAVVGRDRAIRLEERFEDRQIIRLEVLTEGDLGRLKEFARAARVTLDLEAHSRIIMRGCSF